MKRRLFSSLVAAALLVLVGPGLFAVPASGQEVEPWEVLGNATVSVHYRPGDSARAARTLRTLAGQPRLPALPDTLPRGVEVYLANDRASFDSLTGGRIPEWGAGVAVPGLRRIVLPAFEGRNTRGWSEARVLRHEWAHVGLHQYLEGLRIPRWFNEGYAEWASGGWNVEEGWRLRIALATGGGPPLDSLTLGWPRGAAEANLAYMLAGTAVEYLVQASGVRGLRLFLERWRRTGSYEASLRNVYGLTSSQLEERWRDYVKDRYGWLFVLSHSAIFWLLLTVLLLVLVWIRRRRDREAMARLRAGDPPDDPTWWETGGRPSPGA